MKQKFPNIILIVMDTVRADHLSCYGYRRKTTPNIDKIAEQGVVFENAFSSATWSPPSHASIFTGKYPSYHKTLGRNVYLARDNTTLASILETHGYSTIGITNCSLVGLGTGFERGFQTFVEPRAYARALPKELHKKASTLSMLLELFIHDPKKLVKTLVFGPDQHNTLTNEIIKGIVKTKQASKKPFFLFVNYFNCHAPYDPPRPFKERFCSGFTEPRLFIMEFALERILGKSGERILDRDLDIMKLKYIAGPSEARFSYMASELQISEKEWEVIQSWYDGEIAYLDHCIHELINFVYNEGLDDSTVLIITADHGENFGQHGLAGHHFGLYDSVLHVPLIMSCPSLIPKKKRLTEIVSTIDILPTVMSLCNLSVKDEIQGENLDPFEERKIHDFVCAECGESVTRWALSFGLRGSRVRSERPDSISPKVRSMDIGSKCIRNGEFKYILSADAKEELYDMVNDPTEENNILNEHPDKAGYLRRQLEKTLDAAYFGPKEISYDEKERTEIIDRLKALGYI